MLISRTQSKLDALAADLKAKNPSIEIKARSVSPPPPFFSVFVRALENREAGLPLLPQVVAADLTDAYNEGMWSKIEAAINGEYPPPLSCLSLCPSNSVPPLLHPPQDWTLAC